MQSIVRKTRINNSYKFRFVFFSGCDERGAMEIKLIFLWVIFFLIFNSKICSAVSDTERSVTLHNNVLKMDRKLSNMSDSVTLISNKIDINQQNIKNNALGVNNVNTNQQDVSIKFNKKIDDNKANISNLYKRLLYRGKKTEEIDEKVLKNTESLNKSEADIIINKGKIDANEKIISEYITNRDKSTLDTEQINEMLNKLDRNSSLTSEYLDRFWVLIAAVLVFFMQAGFKTFEAGMVRKIHDDNVAIKNVLGWLIISLVYFVFGFGVMFGDSLNGLMGSNLFSPTFAVMQDAKKNIEGQYLGLEFFLYQLAFAATAATIVSGAISERIALIPYILLSIFIGCVIYPIFGHWAWGGTYFLNDQGWLYALGFRDFAGSTVVHSIGAWIALAGIIVIGARNGRYDKRGNLNSKDFVPSNLGYSTLGVLILWFGWWGFNGGGLFRYDERVPAIIVNTILSGSAAGLTAFFHALSKSRDKYVIFPKLLGGILGGLVAITACCNTVSSSEAMVIGAIAGLVHNFAHDLLKLKLKLDDPVGAVAVHGFCGAWGTLCVALFGELQADFFSPNSELLFSENGFFRFLSDATIRTKQAAIQLTGIITAFLFSFSLSYLFFRLIRKIPGIGLRVLPSDEKTGSLLGISN